MKLKPLFISGLLTSVFLLSACNGPYSGDSNFDLKTKYRGCDFSKLSAAGAQRCNNIKKECDKRKADTGFRC
jgi:hypothetical protein